MITYFEFLISYNYKFILLDGENAQVYFIFHSYRFSPQRYNFCWFCDPNKFMWFMVVNYDVFPPFLDTDEIYFTKENKHTSILLVRT